MTNEKILTDDAIHKLIVDLEIECDCGIETYPVDNIVPFARAIEQVILQSPEMQALRKDAERYRWLRDGNGYYPEENYLRGGVELDDGVDLAMEQQK